MTEQVVNLYARANLSTRRIAQMLDISRTRVLRILRREGVPVSPQGKGRRRPLRYEGSLTESTLRYLYVECRLSSVQIGRAFGISDRLIRSRLCLWGIERRTRGQWNREDRTTLDVERVRHLYDARGMPAVAVGEQIGVSTRLVLREMHNQGLSVRGGTTRRGESFDITLIEAIYDDELVSETLQRFAVPIRRQPGPLSERFPSPIPLTDALLRALYLDCGLAGFHIELVTGAPLATVLRRLGEIDVVRRPPGGRSPFMRRWRSHQLQRGGTPTGGRP